MNNSEANKDTVKALEHLKEQLSKGKVSVLVGSGFSKNVSTIFPNWSELLYEMVWDMYKDDILDRINRDGIKLSDNNHFEKKRKKIIESIISQKGYLDIVSDYINRKGFRESIDAYIEEHIPIIDKESDKYYLKYIHNVNGEKTFLQPESLECHKRLLRLNWNNIFTTNYDNAIELAYKEQENEISLVKDSKAKLVKAIIENEKSIENIVDQCNNFRSEENMLTELSALSTNSYSIPHEEKIEKKEKLIKENEKFNIEIKNLSTIIDNENINIVKHSSALALQKHRNIIKLHGSIPEQSNDNFEFDGDIHKRYVISKQDYNDYPSKHEAFTQLMRISLLQDSFCLIGFSGIDPNFIAWLGWVRDIIERKPNGEKDIEGSKDKIYLIDVANEKLTPEKELFFRNHRIIQIPICSDEIIKLFEAKSSGNINKNDKREVLDSFLNYLTTDAINNYDDQKLEAYKSIWELLSKSHFEKIIEVDQLIGLTDKLWKLKSISHFGYKDEVVDRAMFAFLNIFDKLYNELLSLERLDVFFRLTLMMFGDSNFPFSRELIDNNISSKIINSTFNGNYAAKFKAIKLRDLVLANDTDEFDKYLTETDLKQADDEIKYELALHKMYAFKCKELIDHLDNWEPCSYFIVLKANLLAHFDNKGAFTILNDFVNNTTDFTTLNNQERLFAYQFLMFLKLSIEYRKDDNLWGEIDSLKKLGVKDVNETVKKFQKDLTVKQHRFSPYTRGGFEWTDNAGNDDRTVYGMQFLQYLMNSGLSLETNRVKIIDNEDWYRVFKLVFEKFPIPSLYYSLQYQSADFTKRVGQDYVSSAKLQGELLGIFNNLSDSWECEQTPEKFKISILYFLSELLIALEPEVWDEFFLRVWKNLLMKELLFKDTMFHVHDFIINGLKYLQKREIIEFIISSLIDNRDKGQFVVKYLYTLSTSKTIDRSIEFLNNSNVPKKIEGVINDLGNKLINNMYVLGNLGKIVNTIQRKNIEKELTRISFAGLDNYNIWHVILYFSEDNEKIKSKIKGAILLSKYLFDSAIKIDDGGRTTISPNNFIDLRKLKKTNSRPVGIEWTKSETKIIFNKINDELNKIDKLSVQSRNFWGYKDLLDEMNSFLIDEEESLKVLTHYDICSRRIQSNLSLEIGEGSLQQRILSRNQYEYYHAIEELTRYLFKTESIGKYGTCIEYVLSKLLVGSEPNFLFTLRKVAIWLRELKDDNCMSIYSDKLCQILNKFKLEDNFEGYVPSYYQYLVTIAEVLVYWNVTDKGIDYWINLKQKSVFNNVKNLEISREQA